MKFDSTKHYSETELHSFNIYGVIYKVTNQLNGKIYIGKTINLKTRANSRKTRVNSGSVVSGLGSAMKEYGFENFTYEIIDIVKYRGNYNHSLKKEYETKLGELEKKWIKKLDARFIGYNIAQGGEGQVSDTTSVIQYDLEGIFIREYESIKEANYFLGVKDNSISGISRVCLGLSKIAFGYQWKYKKSEIIQKKITPVPSEYTILQYDKNGDFIKEYRSPKYAEKILGLKKNSSNKIAECAKTGRPLTSSGYMWKYKENNGFPIKIKSAKEQNKLLEYYKKKAKAVIQYDIKGNYLNEYRTTDDAEKITGISRMTIQKVATGEYYQAGGFQWRYKTTPKIIKKIKEYKYHSNKIVYQYDILTGLLLNTWDSAREACRKNPTWNYKLISASLIGNQKSHRNYYWSFDQLTQSEVIRNIKTFKLKKS